MDRLRRLVLNLNYGTRPMPVAPALVDEIYKLDADIVVFNEHVDQVATPYIPDPFVLTRTDHTTLLVDITL